MCTLLLACLLLLLLLLSLILLLMLLHYYRRDNVGTVELLARYKFFVAFENSVAHDFVTERVYNAWIAGACHEIQ